MSQKAVKFARTYLEDVLSFFGLNTKVEATLEDHTINLQVPSSSLNGFLIGNHGDNLRSFQHLANMAMRSAGYSDLAVVIDVAGYREARNQRLAEQAQEIAKQVLASGQDYSFDFMGAYERRVVHKALDAIDGVTTQSVGEGRERRLVIKKSS